MRQMTLIFMACMILVATLPAVAAGPYDIRLPASPEGCDPQAVTVVGSLQHYRIKKGDDLLELADQALYAAKADGRDCVRQFEPAERT